MSPIETLPVPIQTLYAELVDRAWQGDFAELMAAGGSAYTREVGGRLYWYWRPPTESGARPSPRYHRQDSPALRERIQVQRDLASLKRERMNLVRALRSAGMPTPDRRSGTILAALAAAGAFRLRAVLIGSVAFQCYPPLLGIRLPASLTRTGDLDIGQFHSIAVAVEDELNTDLLSVLRSVDPRFEPVPSAMDARKVMRYAIRVGSQELFSVDLLCPLRGPIRESITTLKALRGNAQVLKFLDFLLYHEINAVVLHGPGVPVNLPAPERYALHKLLVSQMRVDTPQSQAKAGKDLQQADALIRVLASDRGPELEEAWRELRERGPSWRVKADRAVARLSDDTRAIMARLSEAKAPA
jgi:hypothetical protein